PVVAGIDTEVAQVFEAVRGRVPGLALLALPAVPAGREKRASLPLAVLALHREQPSAPTFTRDPRALRVDDVGRGVGQVAHDLPAEGGVGVKQPVHNPHSPSLARA